MADWHGRARSPDFRVKDLDVFRQAMKTLDLCVVHRRAPPAGCSLEAEGRVEQPRQAPPDPPRWRALDFGDAG